MGNWFTSFPKASFIHSMRTEKLWGRLYNLSSSGHDRSKELSPKIGAVRVGDFWVIIWVIPRVIFGHQELAESVVEVVSLWPHRSTKWFLSDSEHRRSSARSMCCAHCCMCWTCPGPRGSMFWCRSVDSNTKHWIATNKTYTLLRLVSPTQLPLECQSNGSAKSLQEITNGTTSGGDYDGKVIPLWKWFSPTKITLGITSGNHLRISYSDPP